MPCRIRVWGVYFAKFWYECIMFFRSVSIWLLKPLLGKGSQTNSLPIGSNRISWKPIVSSYSPRNTLPYRLGQIGLVGNAYTFLAKLLPNCPYRLGQIGLVGNVSTFWTRSGYFFTLPIGSNRISWKQHIHHWIEPHAKRPYRFGQIGLVGNIRLLFFTVTIRKTLPIGSNRISWKL